jgi:hypothetical protein
MSSCPITRSWTYLHVIFITDIQTITNGSRRATPILSHIQQSAWIITADGTHLVQFEACSPCLDHVFQGFRPRIITFTRDEEINGKRVCSSQHMSDIKRRGCACRGRGSCRRTSPTSNECRYPCESHEPLQTFKSSYSGSPEARPSVICCGHMKWTCASTAPAVRISPSPATTSVAEPTTRLSCTPS